jgi:hypothetical protein
MRNIYIHSISNKNDDIFDENVRDDSNRQFIILKHKLFSLGYNLSTLDNKNIDDADFIFFFDFPSVFRYSGNIGPFKYLYDRFIKKKIFRNVYKECISKGHKNKMILFLWEARAVCPKNWDPNFHKLFKIIFTWNDKFIDNIKFFKFNWPQNPYKINTIKIPFDSKKLLVNISMNKKSSYVNELYSERVKAISYFEKKIPNNFDLYGFGWNKPITIKEYFLPFLIKYFKSYKGTISSKWEVLPYYKFSICYENISDEYGWITEKIFDCLKSDCIPIYLGAINISKYIDTSLFIDKRNFNNYDELYSYLLSFTKKDFDTFLLNKEKYLNSKEFHSFSCDTFATIVINTLNLQSY